MTLEAWMISNCHKFEFCRNFAWFRIIWEKTTSARMKTDPYFQRHNCSTLNVLFGDVSRIDCIDIAGFSSVEGVKQWWGMEIRPKLLIMTNRKLPRHICTFDCQQGRWPRMTLNYSNFRVISHIAGRSSDRSLQSKFCRRKWRISTSVISRKRQV